MSVIARFLPDNPVLTKEMRVRMRGARAYWLLAGYVGFLSLVLLFLYAGWQRTVNESGVGGSNSAQLGNEIFTWVLLTQVFLALFITPAITSGSLTIENEQRTMDMLTMSRMKRSSIVVGKLLAATSFTALLLVSSLPLISICFLLGSVDPVSVASSYLLLLMGSILVAAMGLMWSSIAKTTTSAVLYTYVTVFLLFCLGAFLYAANSAPFFGGNPFLNVIRGLGQTWFGKEYLGIGGLPGVGFAIFCLLGGWLMTAMAMARIETYPERRGGLLRLLTSLLFAAILLGLNHWWLDAWYSRGGRAVQAQVQAPPGALIVVALLLMAVVPAFATGDLSPAEARRFGETLRSGWTWRGLKTGKLASGLPFLLLLTLFCLGLYAFAFVAVGKASDITRSATQTATTVALSPNSVSESAWQPGRPVFSTPVTKVMLSPAGDFPQAAIMLLAFVVGLSLFCMFLSIAFQSRWAAWLVVYIGLLMLWVLPAQTHAAKREDAEPGIGINAYYLNPTFALFEMSDPTNYVTYMRDLPRFHRTIWPITTVSWLGIGLLSIAATLPFVRRRARTALPPSLRD